MRSRCEVVIRHEWLSQGPGAVRRARWACGGFWLVRSLHVTWIKCKRVGGANSVEKHRSDETGKAEAGVADRRLVLALGVREALPAST